MEPSLGGEQVQGCLFQLNQQWMLSFGGGRVSALSVSAGFEHEQPLPSTSLARLHPAQLCIVGQRRKKASLWFGLL